MAKFPRKSEGDHLGASHVNGLSEGVEKFLMQSQRNQSGLPPFTQHQCIVVAIGCNPTDASGTADDSDSDPLQADLYTIRLHFWNTLTNNWIVDSEGSGYCLDDKLSQIGFTVGQKLIAYWDAQRNAFIPISTASEPFSVILNSDLPVATNAKTGATSALATLLEWDESINDYVETEETETVWNHSETTEFLADTIGIALKVNRHFWFLGDCAPMTSRGA